ncbi:hypothetical protein MKEN_01480700 [Mycena kentingensis (nom. inval.)]|nr:hypothetical protein MKEN_01480700 [Mycena kentingensis (nom. inval.)]
MSSSSSYSAARSILSPCATARNAATAAGAAPMRRRASSTTRPPADESPLRRRRVLILARILLCITIALPTILLSFHRVSPPTLPIAMYHHLPMHIAYCTMSLAIIHSVASLLAPASRVPCAFFFACFPSSIFRFRAICLRLGIFSGRRRRRKNARRYDGIDILSQDRAELEPRILYATSNTYSENTKLCADSERASGERQRQPSCWSTGHAAPTRLGDCVRLRAAPNSKRRCDLA